jgi:hypothetical protein
VKRKIEKHREKVLRCDSLLQKNPFVQSVPSSIQKKSKRKRKEVPKANDATQGGPKVCYSYNEYRNGCVKFFELLLIYLCIYLSIVDIFQDGFATASGMVDIWGEKGFFYALLMFSLACYYDITCINIGSL